MPDETKTKKPRKSNGKAAAATRAERASETITVGVEPIEVPAPKRSKYPWSALTSVGSYFVIEGATTKRVLNPPEGVKVVQDVRPDGLYVIRAE